MQFYSMFTNFINQTMSGDFSKDGLSELNDSFKIFAHENGYFKTVNLENIKIEEKMSENVLTKSLFVNEKIVCTEKAFFQNGAIEKIVRTLFKNEEINCVEEFFFENENVKKILTTIFKNGIADKFFEKKCM